MTETYKIEIGNPDHKKNHEGRKLLAHGGGLLVKQLMHNKTGGDRIHVPVTIPAGDYKLAGGGATDGGNFELDITPGVEA